MRANLNTGRLIITFILENEKQIFSDQALILVLLLVPLQIYNASHNHIPNQELAFLETVETEVLIGAEYR